MSNESVSDAREGERASANGIGLECFGEFFELCDRAEGAKQNVGNGNDYEMPRRSLRVAEPNFIDPKSPFTALEIAKHGLDPHPSRSPRSDPPF